MLDMGFIHDVRKLLKIIPTDRQTLFFSATMPDQIAKLADNMLYQPVRVEVTPVSTTAERIEQYVYFVPKHEKHNLLVKLLNERKNQRCLIFTRTKHGADRITKALKKSNIHSSAIHGDKSQTSRQSALQNFKTGKLKVLVATDIASRGIDVEELESVINFDLPRFDQDYVHRIGRTGRAGKDGYAFTFIVGKETEHLQRIARKNNMNIEEAQVPSAKDLEDNEIESIKEIINKINLSENATEKYKNLLGKLGLENKSPEEISLALLKLLLDSRVRIKSNIDFQPEEIVKRERSKAKRPFRSSFQDYRGERNSSGRDRKEKSFSSSMRPARKPSPSKYFSKAKSLVK